MTISAYLSIFDDWEILRPALASIDDFVDEIVVVDGAYEWMASALGATRTDPTRSSEEVYDILGSFGKKVKIINGLWRNEPHKRSAGYEACQGRHVMRTDADEIVFFDTAMLEAYLASNRAIAETEIPIYACPGTIRAASLSSPIERLSFLFDKNQISAAQHLNYLWLVLPPRERASLGPPDHQKIYPDPVAFTAHLTHWRPPSTSVNRARFYVMNYIQTTGSLPWIRKFEYSDDSGFDALFKIVGSSEFEDILYGHDIVAAPPALPDGMVLRPSGRPAADERAFATLYDSMLSGLTRLNDDLCKRPRTIVSDLQYLIDASTNRSTANLETNGIVAFNFSDQPRNARVTLSTLLPNGTTEAENLSVTIQGNRLSFALPRIDYTSSALLRRTIALTAYLDPAVIFSKFWSDGAL